jgi:hypothetical protein
MIPQAVQPFNAFSDVRQIEADLDFSRRAQPEHLSPRDPNQPHQGLFTLVLKNERRIEGD